MRIGRSTPVQQSAYPGGCPANAVPTDRSDSLNYCRITLRSEIGCGQTIDHKSCDFIIDAIRALSVQSACARVRHPQRPRPLTASRHTGRRAKRLKCANSGQLTKSFEVGGNCHNRVAKSDAKGSTRRIEQFQRTYLRHNCPAKVVNTLSRQGRVARPILDHTFLGTHRQGL